MKRDDIVMEKTLTLGAWIVTGGSLNATGATLRESLRDPDAVGRLVDWAKSRGIGAGAVRRWVASFLKTEADR